jgi:hypothetical protein
MESELNVHVTIDFRISDFLGMLHETQSWGIITTAACWIQIFVIDNFSHE